MTDTVNCCPACGHSAAWGHHGDCADILWGWLEESWSRCRYLDKMLEVAVTSMMERMVRDADWFGVPMEVTHEELLAALNKRVIGIVKTEYNGAATVGPSTLYSTKNG